MMIFFQYKHMLHKIHKRDIRKASAVLADAFQHDPLWNKFFEGEFHLDRKLGIDLQKDIHEDMKNSFDIYPKLWWLSKPDPNIDHRRVPNLQTLFKRRGILLPVTKNPIDYVSGDIVSWMLPGNLPHIGIVIDSHSGDDSKPLIVHNIGSGPVIEDIFFDYQITGHYRYYGTLN